MLSSNDLENATRCFQLSKIAHSKGHAVNIFLIGEGVRSAGAKTRNMNEKTVTGDCPGDYLPYLAGKEVPIGV